MSENHHPDNDFEDSETLQKVARLAMLAIEPTELPHYGEILSRVLKLVSQIDKAEKIEDLEPMAHPFADLKQLMRPDEVTETNAVDSFQAIAPLTEAKLYLVPKII